MRERGAIRVCSESAGTKRGLKINVTDGVRVQHFDNLTESEAADLRANPRFTGAWGADTLDGAYNGPARMDVLMADLQASIEAHKASGK